MRQVELSADDREETVCLDGPEVRNANSGTGPLYISEANEVAEAALAGLRNSPLPWLEQTRVDLGQGTEPAYRHSTTVGAISMPSDTTVPFAVMLMLSPVPPLTVTPFWVTASQTLKNTSP